MVYISVGLLSLELLSVSSLWQLGAICGHWPGVLYHIMSPPGVSPAAPPATEDLWNDLLNNHTGKLNPKQRAIVTGSEYTLTYTRIMDTVGRMASTTKMKKLNVRLDAIKPVLTHLKAFSVGIATMCQAEANPACLIWGSIEILLTVLLPSLHLLALFC